ncbi:MAG: cytochrome c3 family protein [Acidobacteria bacterium]|nr:cytochrome c3 family protein [Acidobacteriota bacterium]MBI3422609.1 cytochrome c3 family protein [Acidobacteriota bacterium]
MKNRETSKYIIRAGKLFLVALSAWGGMLLLGVAPMGTATAQKKDSCVECHTQMGGDFEKPVSLMKEDIHKARGLSCANCHGGDATQDEPGRAMDPRKGFVAKPKPANVPDFCGKCHSNAEFMKTFNPSLRVDQQREYATSVHGKLLKGGDQNVATCISCHGHHGIRANNDPQSKVFATNVAETCGSCHGNAEYMKSYKIPTDQLEKYKKSVHAKALYERQDKSAPTCNTCHGNHGATPPGVASVANVCGQCHVRQATLFQASPHKNIFDAMGVGECLQCHSNHEILPPHDEMIGTGKAATCASCHNEGDKGYQTATQLRATIDELAGAHKNALDILARAERAGMEISRAKFDLKDAKDSLTNVRVLIHSVSTAEVEKVSQPGLAIAQKSYQAGLSALSELGFRRKGLAVSLFFILFLAGLVFFKIRQLEGK